MEMMGNYILIFFKVHVFMPPAMFLISPSCVSCSIETVTRRQVPEIAIEYPWKKKKKIKK